MASLPITAVLIAAGLFYLRGWLRVRRTIPSWRAASFFFGVSSIWLAAASPLAMLDEQLLTAHMVQHLLLMTIGPAFVLLGFPALAIPGWPTPRIHPLFCLGASTAVLIAWHIPAVFAVTLGFMPLHSIEHVSFFIAG